MNESIQHLNMTFIDRSGAIKCLTQNLYDKCMFIAEMSCVLEEPLYKFWGHINAYIYHSPSMTPTTMTSTHKEIGDSVKFILKPQQTKSSKKAW